ncbi:class I SAM-dependent methyltransferase [Planococcus halocryophilus]|uniref:class I SAM-dependent methyltransferase n=1 Tax=Planococcus halocryophilus TaxID=1215089 RepID=UPI001F10164B|nr:class I SAM-dependent methyltransferase [Planococcus halocryophilus]
MKTVVTTAYRSTSSMMEWAERVSTELSLQQVTRNKRSIKKMHADESADLLICLKERLEFYPLDKTEPFFFHPNSAAYRTKRPLEEDPLVVVSNLKPGDSFLDCTLGLASDSLVASQRVGKGGRVIGCESHPILAYVVQQGLKQYSEMPHLIDAMKRIEVVSGDAVSFLEKLESDSIDVIYMDPMFTEEITEATNFTALKGLADQGQLTAQWVAEAKRVARKSVVLKAHFRSRDFEQFGFVRSVRPNTKFHYGAILLMQENN